VAIKDLACWNKAKNHLVVLPGAFEIMIGASSDDVRLRDLIEVR
jgi:hypothetical protein